MSVAAVLEAARAVVAPGGSAALPLLRRAVADYEAQVWERAGFEPTTRALVGPAGRVELPAQEARIFSALAAARGAYVSAGDLQRAASRTGEPISDSHLRVAMRRLRTRLARVEGPLRVVARPSGGYALLSEIGAQSSAPPRPAEAGVSSQ